MSEQEGPPHPHPSRRWSCDLWHVSALAFICVVSSSPFASLSARPNQPNYKCFGVRATHLPNKGKSLPKKKKKSHQHSVRSVWVPLSMLRKAVWSWLALVGKNQLIYPDVSKICQFLSHYANYFVRSHLRLWRAAPSGTTLSPVDTLICRHWHYTLSRPHAAAYRIGNPLM